MWILPSPYSSCLWCLLCILAFKAQAQETVATATIIADLEGGANEFAFNDVGNLVGGIAGTGADGTTFIVSNQPTASAQPTMTGLLNNSEIVFQNSSLKIAFYIQLLS